MSDFKVTDMYIKPTSCKYVTGNKKAARKGLPAVEAKAGLPAVLKKDGSIEKKAISAIKATPAIPEQKASQTMWIWADSLKMLKEIEARMRDAGVFPVEGEALIDKLEVNYVFRGFDVSKKIGQCYSAENRQVFQTAFKKVKSKEHYNKKGAAILKANKAEKQRKKDVDKKEAETKKKEKAAESAKKGDLAKTKAKKKLPKKTKTDKKDGGDDWPE